MKGILPIHFDSEVAKTVFNDHGQMPRNPVIQEMEMRFFARLINWSPKQSMRLLPLFDRSLVPFMTPRLLRMVAQHLSEHCPQVLANMPNLGAHVNALSRAVHLSRFMHPDALDRLTAALEKEGLSASKY